jgi:hypothetical protein
MVTVRQSCPVEGGSAMLNQIVRNLQIIEKIICVVGQDSVRKQRDRNRGNRRQSNGNQD